MTKEQKGSGGYMVVRPAMITDEMKRRAFDAMWDADPNGENKVAQLSAALEAVAPMLIVAGLREAKDLIEQGHIDFKSPPYTYTAIGKILDRIEELDPQEKHLTLDQQKALHRATRRGAQ